MTLRRTTTALLLAPFLACADPTGTALELLDLRGTSTDPDVVALVNWAIDGDPLVPELVSVDVVGGMMHLVAQQWPNGGYRGVVLNVPAKVGTYTLEAEAGVSGEGSPTYLCLTGTEYCDNGVGTVTVTRADIRVDGDQRVADIAVQLDVRTVNGRRVSGSASGCIDRHSTVSCRNDGGGGGVIPGGSGDAACVNTFRVTALDAYYTQLNTSNSGPIPATGRRLAQSSTPFAGTSPAMFGLLLDAVERVGSDQRPRYQLQLFIPGNVRTLNNFPFRDSNNIPGLEDGAAGTLVASLSGLSDSHRSNRDYGRNRVMGNITITSISPKIRGTVSQLHVVGDGYPTLTQNQAYVRDVAFCIDP